MFDNSTALELNFYFCSFAKVYLYVWRLLDILPSFLKVGRVPEIYFAFSVYILKDIRNSPPAKMLIYCQKFI